MPKMDRVVDVVRGWPSEGARESVETIKTGATLTVGDVVELQSDGTVDKVSATKSSKVGLVIQGNGDSGAASATGKAVVLWGNYIARVSNYTAGAYVVNSPVTAVSGKFALANGTTDPEVGFVMKVVAASATETAHLLINFK